MKTIKNAGAFFLLVLLLAAGCATGSRPQDKISFYILEYPTPAISTNQRIPAALMVKRFSVAPAYNSTKMIFRDGPFRRDEYVFHRWRVNPGDMASGFIGRDLMESGLFRAILSSESEGAADFVLTGSVDEFLEIDEEETWKASLGITVTLSAEKEKDITRKIVFQKTYKSEKILEKKRPAAFVAAMSEAMARISGELIADIYEGAAKRIK